MTLRTLAAACLVSSGLAACDGVADPSALAGRYTLDVDPPVVLATRDVRIQILHDILRVDADGTAVREVREAIDYTDPALRDTTLESTHDFRWSASGSSVEFTYVCPPFALCSGEPTLWGRVHGNAMRLENYVQPGVPLVYRRAEP